MRAANLVTYEETYAIGGNFYYVKAVMDQSIPNQWEALFGIIVILVMFCLVFFCALQNSDTLLVVPLENIMTALHSATVMLKSMKAMGDADEEATMMMMMVSLRLRC